MTAGPRSVLVTGIGVVSSIGIGVERFWRAALDGVSGISPIEAFDTSKFGCKVGGEVKGFDPEAALGKDKARRWGRASQLAAVAGGLALADARLDRAGLARSGAGLVLGSGMGEVQRIERARQRRAAREADHRGDHGSYPFASIARNLRTELDLHGPGAVLTTACAAGNAALAHGYDTIRAGEAEVMLVGGVDAMSCIAFSGFARIFSLAPRACQPFDKHRKGILVGEGAAFLLLEEREHARRRGVPAYAEIAGYGLSCDAHHITAPDQSGQGIVRAMRNALRDAGVGTGEVQYVSAHGTGTVINDRTETACLKEVFGEHARSLAVSATKSMLGHTGGAASAIEAAVCCLAVRDGEVPPTINYQDPDPECDLDCVPNVARRVPVEVALNNAFAFGGNNCCVVVRKDRQGREPHA